MKHRCFQFCAEAEVGASTRPTICYSGTGGKQDEGKCYNMRLFIPNDPRVGFEICCEISTSDDVRRIVRYLAEQFSATVNDKAVGPDSLVWRLTVEGKAVTISLSDWGPFPLSVIVENVSAKDLFERIRQCLEKLPETV